LSIDAVEVTFSTSNLRYCEQQQPQVISQQQPQVISQQQPQVISQQQPQVISDHLQVACD